jgi:hypothetical protein
MAPTARIVSITALRRRFPAVLAAFAMLTVSPGGELRSFAQGQISDQTQDQTQGQTDPQGVAGQPQQQQTLTAEQINQLVAPIALYPDNLLGQILTASTYPLEVVVAARWASSNKNVTGQALEDAMQLQSWDPSVKALTSVPQVLQMMSEKVEWTQQLGTAYLTQPDDIAAAVQILRARADASGNLKGSDKIKVRRVAAPPPPAHLVVVDPLPPEYIVIEPYEPDYLFVPVYDPWVVYGVWPYPAWRPFYWYPPGYVAVGIIGFGTPILVGAAIWANYNWHSRRVHVDVVKFNKYNHVHLANTPKNQSWQHNPAKNAGQKKQFGNFNPKGKSGTGQNFLSNTAKTGNKTGKTFNNQNGGKKNFTGQKNVNIQNKTITKRTTTFQNNNKTFQKSTTIQRKSTTTFSKKNVGGTKNFNVQRNTAKSFNRNAGNFKPNVKPNVSRQNFQKKR